MKKVLLLTSFAGALGSFGPGSKIEMEDDEADRYVAANLAEFVQLTSATTPVVPATIEQLIAEVEAAGYSPDAAASIAKDRFDGKYGPLARFLRSDLPEGLMELSDSDELVIGPIAGADPDPHSDHDAHRASDDGMPEPSASEHEETAPKGEVLEQTSTAGEATPAAGAAAEAAAEPSTTSDPA